MSVNILAQRRIVNTCKHININVLTGNGENLESNLMLTWLDLSGEQKMLGMKTLLLHSTRRK